MSYGQENHGRGQLASAKLTVVALSLLLVSSFLVAGAVRATGYDDVQLLVASPSTLPYQYTFTAYNSSGTQVATYQANYSAAAFELPSGEYLFTVSATYNEGYCTVCVYPNIPYNSSSAGNSTAVEGPMGVFLPINSTSPGNSTAQGNSTSPAGNSTVIPVFKIQPSESENEYGYAVADVTASQTININMANVTEFPTYQVSVKVTFVNGTASSGASVSASIVGQQDYWWGNASNTVTSAETGANGVANLTLPVAPSVITAWDWVPVSVPAAKNETVNVGGQNVSVTVSWEPAYVGLSGSTLLIPSSSTATSASANVTLVYQQPDYWVEPLTAQVAPSAPGTVPSGTVASEPTGVPNDIIQASTAQSGQDKFYDPARIPGIASMVSANGSPALGGLTGWVAAAVVVAALCAFTAAVLLMRQRPPAPKA